MLYEGGNVNEMLAGEQDFLFHKCVAKIRSESSYIANRNTFLPGCVHRWAGLKVCA